MTDVQSVQNVNGQFAQLDKSLKKMVKWMREYQPNSEESFYQVDCVNLALPELGIICFELVTQLKLYNPCEE